MKRYCDLAVKVCDIAFIVVNPSCEQTDRRMESLDWDSIHLPGTTDDLSGVLDNDVLLQIGNKIRDAFNM